MQDRLSVKLLFVLMALLQLDLAMNNDDGKGDTSTFVLNGEWHLLGNKLLRSETKLVFHVF